MSASTDYLSNSAKIESDIAQYSCPFRFCQAGPFTEAALFQHLCGHYRKALARKLTHCLVKLRKFQEEEKT